MIGGILLAQWPELGTVLGSWFDLQQQTDSNPLRMYVPVERAGRKLTYRMVLFALRFRQQSGWLLTIEDLTERVNMRQQMARMDRLASLGRMSAGIAHEVRNPLTGVSLLLDAQPICQFVDRRNRGRLAVGDVGLRPCFGDG